MDSDKDDLAVVAVGAPATKWIGFTGCYMNGASARTTAFPVQLALLTTRAMAGRSQSAAL